MNRTGHSIPGFPAMIALILSSALAHAESPSPYAGQQNREIKALSAQQIEGYLGGHGMGLAKAAELNRHPGPKHVLELAGRLALTEQQIERTRALFESMRREASELGETLVAEERALDQAFADGTLDSPKLRQRLQRIAEIEARIRFVHLDAHLIQAQILSQAQVARYQELRGYTDGGHVIDHANDQTTDHPGHRH